MEPSSSSAIAFTGIISPSNTVAPSCGVTISTVGATFSFSLQAERSMNGIINTIFSIVPIFLIVVKFSKLNLQKLRQSNKNKTNSGSAIYIENK